MYLKKRKINKFRGKSTETGKWVYGDLIMFQGCYIGYAITTTHIDEGNLDKYIEVEVEFSSIGQYIWLSDKNGKEIYEGDIVSLVDTCQNDCLIEFLEIMNLLIG